jgi:tRNA (adenine22-N1)-methyltransferase
MKSKRLNALSLLVEKYKRGDVLADIGSDHGYLPCDLVSRNIVSLAYACDIAQGPLNASIENIKLNHLENKVIPLLGSGMMPIIDKKVDMITISGMGGVLMVEILDTYREKLKNYRFVLQANTGIDILRKYLNEQSIHIIDEAIVEDAHHIYEIIVCEYGNRDDLTELDYIFGPILRKNKDKLFIKKWTHQLNIQKNILKSLDKTHPKYQEVKTLKNMIEGELNDC